MANYNVLKAAVAEVIQQNGNNEITGTLLQQTLLSIITSLGANYQFAGVAIPSTNPGTPDQNVFYLASTAGTYANFGGLVLTDGEIAILKYNGAWSKDTTGAASFEKVNQFSQQIGDMSQYIATDWHPVPTDTKDGYYRAYSTDSEVAANNYQYATIPVTEGMQVKISGYNLNSNAPLAYVANSISGSKVRLVSQSSAGALNDQEATIPAGYDIMYVNGYGNYPAIVKRYGPYYTKTVVDLINERVEKVPGKGLSTNDFTDTEKEKVTTIQDTYLTKATQYNEKSVEIVDGYYIKYDTTQSAYGETRQHTSFPVIAGEKYKVSGYNLNTNFPGCWVRRSDTNTNEFYIRQSTGLAFIDEEITINHSGTLYLNGDLTYQSCGVKKYEKITDEAFYNEIAQMQEDIAGLEVGNITEPVAFEYRDADLFVTATKMPGNPNRDIVHFWQRCLQGTLKTIFTFYRVSKFENTNNIPDASVAASAGTPIFQQSSDCILATRFNSSPLFDGSSEYSSGAHAMIYNDVYYKTAETTLIKIYADGKELTIGDSGIASQIDVIVTTTAYDPFVLYNSLLGGQTPQYDPIFIETMDYRIKGGTIECIDSRQYAKTAHLEAWGGFGSMAFSLPKGYFPAGVALTNPDTDAFATLNANIGVNDGQFLKEDYPDFNHWVRRNNEATTFECVYLTDYGIGVHSEIPDDYAMCWVYGATGSSNKKTYHRTTYHKSFNQGDKQRLSCVYGWFLPISNNANYLVYYFDGLLFVDVKTSFSGTIELPVGFALRDFDVVKKTSTVTVGDEVAADGLDVTATGGGYAILRFNP